jgi:hypothetical protein
MATIEEFAALVLQQTRVYTRVDVGPAHNISGKYMVENATGIIYGIKGYGKVHKGHQFGTLDTIDQWYWGGYAGQKLPAVAS